jgi:hypothetical protein
VCVNINYSHFLFYVCVRDANFKVSLHFMTLLCDSLVVRFRATKRDAPGAIRSAPLAFKWPQNYDTVNKTLKSVTTYTVSYSFKIKKKIRQHSYQTISVKLRKLSGNCAVGFFPLFYGNFFNSVHYLGGPKCYLCHGPHQT